MSLVAWGVAAGAALAVGLARVLASLFFGVGASDPLTYGGVTVLMLASAFIACAVPAARAVRVQPAAILRAD
jgi:ABC-type antimicrobial peptide transport system permease subunit